MSITLVLFWALGVMALALASIILIAVWVYRDAKCRGLEAWVWTLVVVLVPSFIGLLLYFLVGRRETRQPCPSCARPVPARSAFCGYCGAPMPAATPNGPRHGAGKGLLIAGIVGIALTLVVGFGSMVLIMVSDEFDWKPSVSTVYIENHWGDSWNVRFHYTNKSPDASFPIGDDGPRQLYYEGKCQEGPLTLRVYQGEVERTFDLSGGDEVTGSLDLSIFAPGKVRMELDNRDGEGRSVTFSAHWE